MYQILFPRAKRENPVEQKMAIYRNEIGERYRYPIIQTE